MGQIFQQNGRYRLQDHEGYIYQPTHGTTQGFKVGVNSHWRCQYARTASYLCKATIVSRGELITRFLNEHNHSP